MAVGVITMLAGVAAGGGSQAGSHTAGSHAADYVTGTTRP